VQFGFERDGAAPYRFDVRRRALTPGTAPDLFPPNVSGLKLERWTRDYKDPPSRIFIKAQIEALQGLCLLGIRQHRVWLRFLR
jgi:hypothetical protein